MKNLCALLCFLPCCACAQSNCSANIFIDDRHMPPEPVYTPAQQAIFWVSPASPGERVIVTGAFPPRLMSVLVDGKQVPVDTLGSTAFSFVAPTGSRLQVGDQSVRFGAPEIYWSMGMGRALRPDTASAGDTLRIFGVNFPSKGEIYLNDFHFPYTTTKSESATVLLPDLTPGTYRLRVGDGEPVSLVLTAPATGAVTLLSCPGLNGDGVTDNAALLGPFLKSHAPASGDVHIKLPAGTFVLTAPIVLQPHEYLDGVEQGQTILKCTGATPDIWIQGTHDFGLSRLTVTGPVRVALVGNFVNLYTWSKTQTNLGHFVLDHVTLRCTEESPEQPKALPAVIQVAGPDLRLSYVETDNTLVKAYNAVGCELIPTGGGRLTHMHIVLGNGGVGMYLYSYRGVILEDNLVEGVTNSPGANGGTSLPTTKITGSSRDIYITNNIYQNILAHDREAITTDIGGGSYLGTVASSTASVTVLSNTPNWGPDPVTPHKYRMTIIAGTGMGQDRDVVAVSGTAMTLDRPWQVAPDAQSVVTISLYQEHLQIVDNSFDNTGHVQFYGGVFRSQILDNHMHDAMGVSLYSGIYFCSSQPLQDIVVRNNILSGGNGGDTVRTFGIRLSARSTAGISGLLLSGNQLVPGARVEVRDAVQRMHGVLIDGRKISQRATGASPVGQ